MSGPGAERRGAHSEAFPKKLRLRSRAEFLKVQTRGQKIAAEPLLGLYLPNGLPHTRVGLTVSSKVGNAVVRNRIRRCLRECFRKKHHLLPAGVDVVLIARSGAASADFEALCRAFDVFCAKLAGRAS
ncbi:MAG: ribonuclease P protein component [Myxococcaceae bacterium]